MTVSSGTIAKLMAAGLAGDDLLDVIRSIEADTAKPVRTAGAERQRRYRERHRNVTSNVTGDASQVTPVSPKERSPLHPPKEITPSTLSEANASSSEPRAGTTSEPMARIEFDAEFWPRYPNKVGKSPAMAAFIAARRKAPLAAILGGLERYKATIPDGRQWLNPATFLNQERWNDEPAPATARQHPGKPEPPHDAIFRALADAASECDGRGRWPPDDDVRVLDYRPGT